MVCIYWEIYFRIILGFVRAMLSAVLPRLLYLRQKIGQVCFHDHSMRHETLQRYPLIAMQVNYFLHHCGLEVANVVLGRRGHAILQSLLELLQHLRSK